MGEMLAAEWEKFATVVANASASELKSIILLESQEYSQLNAVDADFPVVVVLGCDTRPSCKELAACFRDGWLIVENKCGLFLFIYYFYLLNISSHRCRYIWRKNY